MSDVVLISTTDIVNGRSDMLERMLSSVARECEDIPARNCVVVMLLQNCSPDQLQSFRDALPAFAHAFAIPNRVSLSAARNILISRIGSEQIGAETVVGFPDDDCWYPAGSLAFAVQQFAENPQLDLWFCRYGASPQTANDTAPARQATVHDIVRNASSNTIFVRGRVLNDVSSFDERLGVGTPNLGGEDLDFALRAHAVSRLSRFHDQAAIGHRDKLKYLRATYYRGSLLVLARYARRNVATAGEYMRKVAIGIYLVLCRELTVGAFLKANTLALTELRRGARG